MTFKEWPLGQIPDNLKRKEIDTLLEMGYHGTDPRDAVSLFEQKVAAFAGSKYGIAVDCCSHGLFLSLKYLQASGTVTIPSRTYVSVPNQIILSGNKPVFDDKMSSIAQFLGAAPVPFIATF
jgi:dTDP-4-amino-4,6-dideoxygalactose transaminase